MNRKLLVNVKDPNQRGKKCTVEVEHIKPRPRTIPVQFTEEKRVIEVPEYYRERAKRNSESD